MASSVTDRVSHTHPDTVLIRLPAALGRPLCPGLPWRNQRGWAAPQTGRSVPSVGRGWGQGRGSPCLPPPLSHRIYNSWPRGTSSGGSSGDAEALADLEAISAVREDTFPVCLQAQGLWVCLRLPGFSLGFLGRCFIKPAQPWEPEGPPLFLMALKPSSFHHLVGGRGRGRDLAIMK